MGDSFKNNKDEVSAWRMIVVAIILILVSDSLISLSKGFLNKGDETEHTVNQTHISASVYDAGEKIIQVGKDYIDGEIDAKDASEKMLSDMKTGKIVTPDASYSTIKNNKKVLVQAEDRIDPIYRTEAVWPNYHVGRACIDVYLEMLKENKSVEKIEEKITNLEEAVKEYSTATKDQEQTEVQPEKEREAEPDKTKEK